MDNELFKPSRLLTILQELSEQVRDKYRDNLKASKRIASGELYEMIGTEVEVKGTHYSVYLDLRDYWKYVEEDTRPHWPPLDAIARWVFVKPIIPRPDSRGRIPTQKQLAFLIGRAMAGESPNQLNCKNPQGGTKGSHDLERAKAEVLPTFEERIMDALHDDAMEYINRLLP